MPIDSLLTSLSKRLKIDLHYFAKGGFWLLVAQGGTIIGSLLGTIVFANILSEESYGIYRYLVALAVLFSTFSLTGITQAVLQTAAKGHTEFFPYAIRISLLYNLGTTITSLGGSIYYFINDNSLLAIGCLLIAFFQPLIASFQNTTPLLQGLKMFKQSALLQISKTTLITVAGIISVYLTNEVLILFLVFLFSQTLANVTGSLLFSIKNISSIELSQEIKKRYVNYARHLSVQNLIIGISTRIDNVLVFQQLGAANLALFSIATVLPDQVKGASKNLVTLLIPKFAKHATLSEIKMRVPKRSIQLFTVLAMCSAVLILIIPYIYELFFPKYIEAIPYSQLLLLALPASVYFVPLSALQSHLKDRELYKLNIYSSIFQILITLVLIYTLGLFGAILSRIASRYFQMLLTFLMLRTAD